MKSSNHLCLVLTVTFSQISLISRGQRDVTWKLPIIPFEDCRMHFYTLFPTNFTKQLETAHHQLKKVITHIETKYQCLLTSVMTFRLTCHVTEFGGPSSVIWHDSELLSQVFPYQKKTNIIVFNMIICFEEKKLHTYPSL